MAFEIYEYQVEELERLDEESRKKTKRGINKSQIIRNALDYYLGLNEN
jgi:hypothetical protein